MKTCTPMALKVLLAFLVLAGVGGVIPEPQQTLAKQFQSVDLAALGLTPKDLEVVGLEGYGADYGVLQSSAEFAASVALREGYSPEEALDAIKEMGLMRTYTLPLSLPVEGGRFEDAATAGVLFTIIEFDTEANAALMFDTADDDIESGGREVVEGTQHVGEDSILSRSDGEEEGTGDPWSDVMLEFYVDNFYVVVDVFDIARDGEFAAPAKPTISVAEGLGAMLFERIESAGGEPLPELGTQVLRMTAEDGSVVTVADRYNAIDGIPHRRYAETDDALATRSDLMERDRLVTSYVVEQDIVSSNGPAQGDTHMIVRLFEFEDDTAASAWLEETAFDRYSEADYITEIEPVRLSFDLGDGTIGASYEGVYDGADIVGNVVWVQVNHVVSRISLDATEAIDLAVLEKLAEEQVSCLRGGQCASIGVPNVLT